jgi:predicted TPR repeat methyltransferase
MPEPEAGGRSGDDNEGISLSEALAIAVRAHRSRDFATAEIVYERILDAAPDHADAVHFLGVLRHQTGQSLEAVRLIRRAIELDPDDPGKHMNLGNVLLELDRPDLAMQGYRMAIVLSPGHVEARNNLGVALRALRREDEAEEVYREAIELDPGRRDSWDNLGRLMASQGRMGEAATCHARALELEPTNAHHRRQLVAAYGAARETDRAVKIIKEWLADEPHSPSGHHLLAAFSGENIPGRASDAYVETLFDDFASRFDHKLAILDYRAPELIGRLVAASCGAPTGSLDVLDAGCGTGLCGPYLRPFAARLTGVDLSGNMLERARARAEYDELQRSELTGYLLGMPGAFDLIVSADTLVYFGDLGDVLAACAAALRDGGLFVFNVEQDEAMDGFGLRPTGRYAHREQYVAGLLDAAGFRIRSAISEPYRVERGEPVSGLFYCAQKR